MELERLQIRLEAATGDSATQVSRLNKVLEEHAGALDLAKRAEDNAKRTQELYKAGVIQASAAILRAEREQEAAAKKRLAAGNAMLASMKRTAAAEAKAEINTKGFKAALEGVTEASRKADAMFAQIDRTLAQGAKTADAGTKKQKSFGDSFFAATQKAFFFLSAVDRVFSGVKKLYSAFEEGARTAAAQKYFEAAGRSLEELRTAARGMVSDSNLMKKANLADTMGLSGETFKSLLQTAQAASAKTGQSFDHMFDSIVVGTARSSRLLLDNLGIIVSIDEANRRLAAEYQKDARYQHMTISQIVDAFDDEAKKIAFVEEVARKAAPAIKDMNTLGETGAEAFDRFSAAIDNMVTALSQSVAVGGVLSTLTDIADTITRIVRAWDSMSTLQKAYMVRAMATGLQGGMLGGKEVEKGTSASDVLDSVESREFDAKAARKAQIEEYFKNMADSGWGLFRSFKDIYNANDTILHQMDQATQSAVSSIVSEWKQLVAATTGAGRFKQDGKKRPDLPKGEDDGKDWKNEGLNRVSADVWAALDNFWENEEKEIDDALKKMIQEAKDRASLREEEDRLIEDDLKQMIQNAKDRATLRQNEADELEKAAKEAADKWKAQEEAAVSGINAGATAVSGDTGAVVEMLATAIGAAAGSAGIGAAIGKLLSPFLNSMGGLTDVVMGLFNGFSLLIEHAVGPLLSTLAPLGEALQYLMAAVGKLIAAALEPLIPLLKYFFAGLAVVIDFITALIVVLGPVIGLFAELAYAFLSAGIIPLFNAFMGGGDTMIHLTETMNRFGESMIMTAIGFNNAIVSMVNNIGKFLKNDYWSTWGDKLDWDDFQVDSDEDDGKDDNTDAVNENTRALRDLAREFHNLPSGYKGNAAIYNAANREAPYVLQNPTLRNRAIEQMSENALSSRRFNPFR